MALSSQYTPILLCAAVLLLLPVAFWVERTDASLWHKRFAIPEIISEPNRHTPVHATGTILPSAVESDTILDQEDSPIILKGITYIEPRATLTITEGVNIVVHEYGQLIVHGNLRVQGIKTNIVTFTSNETHMENRVWGGIVLTETGQATIEHARLRYGSPAVSCMKGSTALLRHVTIEFGNLGLFTESEGCRLEHSAIRYVATGFTAVGVKANMRNTEVSGKKDAIKTVD